MPTPITTSNNNLHTVAVQGQPLGVEYRSCGRHAVAFAGKVQSLSGNMRELRTLRFVCSACGSRDWQGWLFLSGPCIVGPVVGSRLPLQGLERCLSI